MRGIAMPDIDDSLLCESGNPSPLSPNPTPRYTDFTVPIEKRVAPRRKSATSMGFAAEGLAPGQRFPGDTQGEAEYRAGQKTKQEKK